MVDYDDDSKKVSQNLPVVFQERGSRTISHKPSMSYRGSTNFDVESMTNVASPTLPLSILPSVVNAVVEACDAPSELAHRDAMRKEEILDKRTARLTALTPLLAELDRLGDSPAKQYVLNELMMILAQGGQGYVDHKA